MSTLNTPSPNRAAAADAFGAAEPPTVRRLTLRGAVNTPALSRRRILTAKASLGLGAGSLLAFAVASALGALRGFPTQFDLVLAGGMFVTSSLGLIAAAGSRKESVPLRFLGAVLSLASLLIWSLCIMGQGI